MCLNKEIRLVLYGMNNIEDIEKLKQILYFPFWKGRENILDTNVSILELLRYSSGTLATFDFIKSFHYCLLGERESSWRDHISFRWLMSFKDLEEQTHWLERLQYTLWRLQATIWVWSDSEKDKLTQEY